LVISVAGVAERLSLDARKQVALAWSLILMAYGNVVASVIGATFGVRGLSPSFPAANVAVYVIFMAAVVGVILGLVLVAYAARRD
jgi:cation transporter-like permease